MPRKTFSFKVKKMDEKEPFELLPYAGAGKIRFGMTPKEVETIYGVADSTSSNHLKQRVEFRSSMNVAYSSGATEGVSHIGFGRQMQDVRFKDVNLFFNNDDLALKRMILEDGSPQIYLGFIVLLKLGITLTGFHDNDVAQKAVALFPPGAWDKRIAKLKPFSLQE